MCFCLSICLPIILITVWLTHSCGRNEKTGYGRYQIRKLHICNNYKFGKGTINI